MSLLLIWKGHQSSDKLVLETKVTWGKESVLRNKRAISLHLGKFGSLQIDKKINKQLSNLIVKILNEYGT